MSTLPAVLQPWTKCGVDVEARDFERLVYEGGVPNLWVFNCPDGTVAWEVTVHAIVKACGFEPDRDAAKAAAEAAVLEVDLP